MKHIIFIINVNQNISQSFGFVYESGIGDIRFPLRHLKGKRYEMYVPTDYYDQICFLANESGSHIW